LELLWMLELGIWCFPHVAMTDPFILATNSVTRADLAAARLGQRFGRMDLASQLSLLAAEPFAPHFDNFARDRIAIVIAVRAGSLPTDVAYWEGRDQPGGLSPTLFTYTLPSAAIGEIAIRHRLTGPNLCFVGDSRAVLTEAVALLRTDEADAVIAISTNVISPALTKMIHHPETAGASAVFISHTGPGLASFEENHRDMETLCANLRAHNLTK
jgi:3-oxoacyl-(acyl-carrier-protein) synthase